MTALNANASPVAVGLFCGAAMVGLLAVLARKGVINADEVREILSIAAEEIGPHVKTPDGGDASRLARDVGRNWGHDV